MSKSHPKSTDGLMRYLRDKKGIAISGSSQKRKLMNIGYYHGYKGYRYIYSPSNKIPYTRFEELVSIYDFDAQLKSLFYPSVMCLMLWLLPPIQIILQLFIINCLIIIKCFPQKGNCIKQHPIVGKRRINSNVS